MKQLPSCTRYYFEQFAHIGGAWNWHALDEKKFRTFIHAAHQWRAKLSARELEALLIERGFNDEDASDLAEWYQFGRDLLKNKPRFNYLKLRRIGR